MVVNETPKPKDYFIIIKMQFTMKKLRGIYVQYHRALIWINQIFKQQGTFYRNATVCGKFNKMYRPTGQNN